MAGENRDRRAPYMTADRARQAADDPLAEIKCPESLRRRGPATIEFVGERGETPAVCSCGLLLHSGRRYTARVKIHSGADGTTIVTMTTDDSLRVVVPCVGRGNDLCYSAIFKARCVQQIKILFFENLPWPARGDLVLSLHHDNGSLFSLTIPFVVMPNIYQQSIYALIAVGGFAWELPVRLLATEFRGNHCTRVSHFDLPYFLALAAWQMLDRTDRPVWIM